MPPALVVNMVPATGTHWATRVYALPVGKAPTVHRRWMSVLRVPAGIQGHALEGLGRTRAVAPQASWEQNAMSTSAYHIHA